MEIKDISYNGIPEKGWNTSDSKEIEKVGKEKIESLKKEIMEVEKLIKEREQLSRLIIDEAEKVKMDTDNFLVAHKPVDSDALKESIALKQKQVEVSELQLKEKVSCWQDTAILKKELRECEKELADRESRLKILDKILED